MSEKRDADARKSGRKLVFLAKVTSPADPSRIDAMVEALLGGAARDGDDEPNRTGANDDSPLVGEPPEARLVGEPSR